MIDVSLVFDGRYVENATLDKMAEALRALGAFGDSCTFEMVRKEIETYSDFELHNLCVEYGVVKELRDLQLPKEVCLSTTLAKDSVILHDRLILPHFNRFCCAQEK